MPNSLRKQVLVALSALLIALLPVATFAAPGDILFSDDFNRVSLSPWTTTNPSVSGILVGGQPSSSSPRAGYTSNQTVTVTSPVFNAAVPAARLEIWVRRGSGAPFTYIPMPDGQGFDPLVTGFRAAPTGTMNGSVGGNNPSFDIIFQIRID